MDILKRQKKNTIRVYLNFDDEKRLEKLSQKRNESKSAIIRKLIASEKYAKALKEIERNNLINLEFLNQIAKCGNNLNQIAFHLNADFESPKEVQTNLLETINEFKELLQSYKERFKEKYINLEIGKIKSLSKEKGGI
ncbi:hypothetical protein BA184_07745 [Helicobacter pullorum]|uniref:plasmid mobilization relaxosome protein MobC n=1 Tax=Helicobacter pullorum TaxID=35818 RepID=UPI00081690A9|nr:plasmid mobilization relaxosome protein MobC [Helicobacter pullorum]OCR03556.1 hypothetical protein BA729_06500 [Helicobacter pullorum]OCR06283.1 hypothetical protein BA185_07285 [Helicobacter pullorum]OCR08889.1 hypothetical protein BA184_07745 [Helicobacter pullorum]OCR12178.1 hypothetical protein BA730_06010 [Helicobacter pullorum]